MRIFVYEHVAGGGFSGRPRPPSLAREGSAMLSAICGDLAGCPGVSIETTLDRRARGATGLPSICGVHEVSSAGEADDAFLSLSRAADGVLVIAPELDGDLHRLVRRVEEAGGRHLGASPDAIEAASDKLLLPGLLDAAGIPCVPAAEYGGSLSGFALPAVVKPRRGAGSTDVFLIREGRLPPAGARPSIITPFASGMAASVLLLLGDRGIVPLRASEQTLSADGRLAYLGGRIPLPPALELRARRLALGAARAVPGLSGFAGVDMVLGQPADSAAADVVVEINPRLTTSYVGLRAHSLSNLASAWLAAVTGREIPEPAWKEGVTTFTAAGAVEVAP